MRDQRRAVWLLGGVVVLLALAGLPAGVGTAQEEEAAQQEDSEELKAAKGRVTFRVYCSNCHGADAKGDGKLAPLLSVKPADLTRLIIQRAILLEYRFLPAVSGRVHVGDIVPGDHGSPLGGGEGAFSDVE